jgi:rhodanese-related sulfurtransferase
MRYFLVLIVVFFAFFAGFFINNQNICRGFSTQSQTVGVLEFSHRLTTCNPILLDIRTPDEFSATHIPGARNSDFNQSQQFADYLDTLDKGRTYFIYCRTGKRSAAALKLMNEKGFKYVINLDGGITAWQKAGFPTSK